MIDDREEDMLQDKAMVLLATDEIESLVANLRLKIQQKKKIEEEIEYIKKHIQEEMDTRDTLVNLDGLVIVRWAYSKPVSKFDKDLLKQDHPDIYEKYVVEGKPVRTFLVK